MRPYVVINVAASLDGKIDTVERHGAAISTERDRQRVDALRASVDAVMVGGRTLVQEDPRLTVKSAELRAARLARGQPENPAKVAVISQQGPNVEGRFVNAGPARVILFVASSARWDALRERGVEVFAVGEGRVDLVAALAQLAELGFGRVLVEGGGALNFALLQLGLVDEVQVFVAPLIFGGATAPTLADGAGLARDLAVSLGRPEEEPWADGGVLLRYRVNLREPGGQPYV